jgi:predicted membrane-bound mannosyltransferase
MLFQSAWQTILDSIYHIRLLAALVFAWSSKLYGSLGGLLSLVLHSLNPNLLAHSRLATTDLPCALFMFLSVYLFVRYLKTPSRRNLILAAVATGVAQVTKHTALLLFPAFAILTICYAFLLGSVIPGTALRCFLKSLRWRAVHAALFGFVVLLAINIGYG